MQPPLLHKFQIGDRRFVIDPETCFCFECDHISWDVLAYYPQEPINHIYHLLKDRHPLKELEEVVGELEWLRITKAILTSPSDEPQHGAPELKRIVVAADAGTPDAATRVAMAGNVLLAASGNRRHIALHLCFSEACDAAAPEIATCLNTLKHAARFADKNMTVVIETTLPALGGLPNTAHYLFQVQLAEDANHAACIRDITALCNHASIKKLNALKKQPFCTRVTIMARPVNANFHALLQEMVQAEQRDILLDIPGIYLQNPQQDPAVLAEALRVNAAYYAEQLLQGAPVRVEPFATLFDAIHQGKPVRRIDGAGYWELAVDNQGRVFPSRHFMEMQALPVGTLADGGRDENALEPFSYLGAEQMAPCRRCWARCLCGGGHAIIHWLRSDHPRTPDPSWCDGQRQWLAHVIDAFNMVVSSGLNFSHIIRETQPQQPRMSWLKAAKAAYQIRLIPRPLREADAAWLVKWENWNNAAYFVCNEYGLLLATSYDREMDALHPRELGQELVLTRRTGEPCGLLKVQPDMRVPGLTWAWLYMQDPKAYEESGIRRTLSALLKETVQGHNRRILVPVTHDETALATCLESIGFTHGGTQRQALYLHGTYHDVALYQYEN